MNIIELCDIFDMAFVEYKLKRYTEREHAPPPPPLKTVKYENIAADDIGQSVCREKTVGCCCRGEGSRQPHSK